MLSFVVLPHETTYRCYTCDDGTGRVTWTQGVRKSSDITLKTWHPGMPIFMNYLNQLIYILLFRAPNSSSTINRQLLVPLGYI